MGNELVWTWENHKVARKDTLDLVARVANAVHAHSKVLVCEGEGAGPKYNSDKFEGNFYSDKALGALQPGAHVDFYNIHYYDWVRPHFGSPFERSPADYGMDDKPCIIGECPARGSAGQSIADNYRNAFAKGWQGIMPWTSNGADRNGNLKKCVPGSNGSPRPIGSGCRRLDERSGDSVLVRGTPGHQRQDRRRPHRLAEPSDQGGTHLRRDHPARLPKRALDEPPATFIPGVPSPKAPHSFA